MYHKLVHGIMTCKNNTQQAFSGLAGAGVDKRLAPTGYRVRRDVLYCSKQAHMCACANRRVKMLSLRGFASTSGACEAYRHRVLAGGHLRHAKVKSSLTLLQYKCTSCMCWFLCELPMYAIVHVCITCKYTPILI